MRLDSHSNLLQLIRDGGGGGMGTYYLLATLSPPELLSIKAGSCVRHFNGSLIVWAKSQDSVRKPHFLKRKESQRGSNQDPSACQSSGLPLGHTHSHSLLSTPYPFMSSFEPSLCAFPLPFCLFLALFVSLHLCLSISPHPAFFSLCLSLL